ncbi:hypothetical protein IFM89_027995 [Coptis chinensis]|uniref:Uncharacterized protein n=1 Tax=Coptis chinensis TaxID=261450 RepID=A0A835LCR6_9MAGN|nr:hypothetical protein IFM89_027995 [Coptis chinensis]
MDDAVNPKPDSKQSLYYVNDDLGFGGGRGFNGRGARGNSGFWRGNRGGFGGRRGRGDRYDGTDERKCTYCGKDSHTEPFCWDKHGKPAYAHNAYDQTFGSSAAGPSSASPPSTAEVLGQILNRLNFVPIPVVPSEEVPPAPIMPCAEGPSRVPITTVRGSMPIYAQYHRIFPRKKVTNVESTPVTTVEPALKQSSSSLEAPSVRVIHYASLHFS